MRIGYGCDTHRLVEGRKLILGGVEIEHTKGLLGHSDADALCHSVIDALFGAANLGDIGSHFPDTSPEFKDADSIELLREAGRLIRLEGYEIENIDSVIIAQKPKMAPHIKLMAEKMAAALEISPQKISVKAKTNEKMGFTGREEGIEVRAVCLLV
ncbi:MAG: 2-C-methyl-D-erythritol 2,4-cyclodiphosphate synthase [Clostridia bacterium]